MLQAVDDVRLQLVPGAWPLTDEIRGRVDEHWRAQVAANPHLWNGKVLGALAPGLPGGVAIKDGVISAHVVEGDFASFIAWRDWGFPEVGIRNLFGSALVLSADGAIIFGVMADTTANAGKIYPPGGSLEPSDCDAEGRVGLVASIERELNEETGLIATDARCEGMLAAFDGPRVAIGRLFRFAARASDLVDEIMANLEHQEERELARVVAFRPGDDLDSPMLMPYARTFAASLVGDGARAFGLG